MSHVLFRENSAKKNVIHLQNWGLFLDVGMFGGLYETCFVFVCSKEGNSEDEKVSL